MLLDIYKMASIAKSPYLSSIDKSPYLSPRKYWRPSSVAVLEANGYEVLPENISNNVELVEAVRSKDPVRIAVESLKCIKDPYGPEHDEAIVIAFAMKNGLLTQVTKDT